MNKYNVTIRLDDETKQFLESRSCTKSLYVRNLIRDDMVRQRHRESARIKNQLSEYEVE